MPAPPACVAGEGIRSDSACEQKPLHSLSQGQPIPTGPSLLPLVIMAIIKVMPQISHSMHEPYDWRYAFPYEPSQCMELPPLCTTDLVIMPSSLRWNVPLLHLPELSSGYCLRLKLKGSANSLTRDHFRLRVPVLTTLQCLLNATD